MNGESSSHGGLALPGRGTKRPHSQMAEDTRRSNSPLFVPHLQLPRLSPSIRSRHSTSGQQHVGNRRNFDLRRPVSLMQSTHSNIIDLTEDNNESLTRHEEDYTQDLPIAGSSRTQRLPRYDREIIDLSAEMDPPAPQDDEEGPRRVHSTRRLPRSHMATSGAPNSHFRRESSSDVVFVSERPRSSTPRSGQTSRQASRQPSSQPVLDLTAENDDEVVHVRTQGRQGLNLHAPVGRGEVRTHQYGFTRTLAGIMARERARPGRLLQRMQQLGVVPHLYNDDDDEVFEEDFDLMHEQLAGQHRRPGRTRPGFVAPGRMDYGTIGFGLGADGGTPRDPTPEYRPPPAAEVGFTRNPTPEEEVVCPSCGDELATGSTEEKRQVWIVKACGHVYCGHCMQHRAKRQKAANNKGKARATDPQLPKPFHICVVEGCQSKVSNRSHVMQIFL